MKEFKVTCKNFGKSIGARAAKPDLQCTWVGYTPSSLTDLNILSDYIPYSLFILWSTSRQQSCEVSEFSLKGKAYFLWCAPRTNVTAMLVDDSDLKITRHSVFLIYKIDLKMNKKELSNGSLPISCA